MPTPDDQRPRQTSTGPTSARPTGSSEDATIAPEQAGDSPPAGTDPSDGLQADTVLPNSGIVAGERGQVAASTGTTVRYFGDYELLEEVARGGMGVVYKAKQVSLNRNVALKMILAGRLASESDVQRFHTEAEAAARLDHPGIVPVYEVGEHEGQHYFSMGYVEGQSLADKLNDGPLPPKEAAELAKQLAEAVVYAHEQGVIHRDLKPANVLLDNGGQPRITDFGLAKKMEVDSNLTGSGQILGTPSYMPPEQAGGKTQEVGPTADVYALGAVLYTMLTGRPPFQAANPMDTLLQVLEKEPVAVRQLDAGIPRDLETICLKCLQKQPPQRYSSAAELSEELGRFLRHEPIVARPISPAARVWRWARRRPAAAGFLAATVVAMMALVGLGVAYTYQQQLVEANDQLEQVLYFRRVSLALSEWKDGEITRADQFLQECPVLRRDWEWFYVYRLCHAETRTFEGHRHGVRSVTFSVDGTRIATADFDGSVKVWDLNRNQEVLNLPGDHIGYCAAFSPDGKRLASGGWDLTARVWDAETGRELLTFKGHSSAAAKFRATSVAPIIADIAFSPDGKRIASSDGMRVKVWDAESGQEELTLGDTRGIAGVVFSPDGTRIAIGGMSHRKSGETARVWDAVSGEQVLSLPHPEQVLSVAFSPDGKRIATGGYGRAMIWDTTSGEELRLFKGQANVSSVAFGPMGKRIVGSDQLAVTVWNAESGQVLYSLWGHAAKVNCVAFSPSGEHIVSGSEDRTAKLWQAKRGHNEALTFKGHGKVTSVAISPDGRRIAAGDLDGIAGVWDTQSGQQLLEVSGHNRHLRGNRSVAFSPDGKRVAIAGATVTVWDIEGRKQILTLKGHKGGGVSVTYSPDGERIASGGWDWTVKVWDAESGEEFLTYTGHHISCVTSVAFSADGKRIASGSVGSGSEDNSVNLWDARSGTDLVRRKTRTDDDRSFSPDGRRIAVCTGGRVVVWDVEKGKGLLESGESVLTLHGHSGNATSVTFSPDGKRIATGSEDGTVKIWDAGSGHEALTLKGHTGRVNSVVFSSDGGRIATGSDDRTVKVWDASNGHEALNLIGH